MRNTNNRLLYFDIAKFIGMMMIILGHFGVPDINTFVYTFHIPLFFLISGYFFKPNKNFKEYIKNKFKQLIIPYFIVFISVVFINILINLFINPNLIVKETINYIIGFIYGSGYIENILNYKIENIGPIWFLLALFWNFIILNFIIDKKYINIILISLFFLGYVSAKYIWLPFSIQSSFTSISFMYLGYIGKKYDILNKPINITQIIALLCMWSIMLNYGGKFLIAHNDSVHLITDYIGSICASFLVILYAKWLENNTKSAKYMAYLGKYTIIILCFHTIDVLVMPWNNLYKLENTTLNIVFLKIMITFIKFLFPILGIFIVIKLKYLSKLFNINN